MIDGEPGGWAGRVMVFLRVAAHLVAVNLLVGLGTLVGLGVGGLFPALDAGGRLLARLAAGDPSDRLWRDFWSAFARGWRRSVLVGVPFWCAGAFVAADLLVLRAVAPLDGGPVAALLLGGVVLLAVYLLVALAYVPPTLRRYDEPVGRTLRFVALAPLLSPLTALAVAVTTVVVVMACTAVSVLAPLVALSLPLLLGGLLVDRWLDVIDRAAATSPAQARIERPGTAATGTLAL
ncbi:DUF624 domain-containing protein [Oerskovia flava]|uniref:DUF624 domain-containing protein n=1 Tax=Oerskovia flava TaxID=2986422 RepID=UPI002240ADAD|nr:DUF624 domain-containing protein [Oerskovia sp. JB1-3-2]